MSPDGQTYITADGLQKLMAELKQLKTIKRKEITARIQEAKELGDLSENAEYAEAKTEQAFIEGRIIELENAIKSAVLITEGEGGGVIHIGSTVKVKTGIDEQTYTIVGSNEADPIKHLISNESPLGEAFIGHRVGEVVQVKTPKGPVEYSVLAVN